MLNVSYVTCPQCKGEFYIDRSDFSRYAHPCHCPFCATEFPVNDGNPRPPLHLEPAVH